VSSRTIHGVPMLYFDGDTFDWMHALERYLADLAGFATIAGIAFGVWWKFKCKREDDAEKERKALLEAARLQEENANRRHNDNLRVQEEHSHNLKELTTSLELNPPHEHDESNVIGLSPDTSLKVGNIRYKKLKRIKTSERLPEY
jgi:hypothetical protein